MSWARRPRFWLAAVVVVFYGVRAFVACMDGWAYPIGKRLAAEGEHERALPLLVRGAVGPKRPAALWLAGQVRVAMWHRRALAGEPPEEISHLLSDAFHDHSEALALNPASGWYWVSLGELYHRQEQVERYRHGVPLELLERGEWAFVGRPGRIAIGMTRIGIELEPTWFLFQDQLALMLADDELDQAALAAVRRSAAVLPFYNWHAYRDLDPAPDGIIDAFAEGARAALGQAPLLDHGVHLAALGRLELRRGRWAQAVEDFQRVLELPAPNVNTATLHLNLGLALTRLGRFEEAEAALCVAEQSPGTETRALVARVALAEARGDLEQALQLLRRVRRQQPRQVEHALHFARIARRLEDWIRAEEALRWALTLDPERVETFEQLIEVNIRKGELAKARGLVEELSRIPGTEETVRAFDRRLSSGPR